MKLSNSCEIDSTIYSSYFAMEQIIQNALFTDHRSLYLALTIFLAGVLTSFTPCVYPILPVTVSVITQHAKNLHQSVFYTLLYIFGLAMVYSLLGYLAATTGHLFGSVASHPIVLIFAGSVCLLMAAWMLGFITPNTLVFSPNIHSASATINVLMAGCLSGLVMAPCTAPVLGMLLLYVASEHAPIMGAFYLFLFALGLSFLILLCGIFSNLTNHLPSSGRWLNGVKWVLALMLVGVAFYYYSQIIF